MLYFFRRLYKETSSLIIRIKINIIVNPSSVVETIISPPLQANNKFFRKYRSNIFIKTKRIVIYTYNYMVCSKKDKTFTKKDNRQKDNRYKNNLL